MAESTIEHSDFIIYVDESGDHSLESIDADYPVFVLSFCIFRKGDYAQPRRVGTVFVPTRTYARR